jgi:hypothetical protein
MIIRSVATVKSRKLAVTRGFRPALPHIMKRISLLLVIPLALGAQTMVNGGRIFKGTLDASGAASTLPYRTGAGSPAGRDTCGKPGETYFQTEAPAGQNVWGCTAAGAPGTWSQMTAGASVATGTSAPGGSCSAGALYVRTDMQQFYICSATNTWQLASYGSGVSANKPANCVTGQVFLATDAGALWFCAVAGSPGTWQSLGGALASVFGRTGAVTAQAGDYTAAQVTNAAQTNAGNTFTAGTQNFSGAAHTLPAVTGVTASRPPTCTIGEMYFATDATAGQNWYYCTAANTWTQQSSRVPSVFGRTGAVTAQPGDYTAAQVTNAAAVNAANTWAGGFLQNFSADDVLLPIHASDPASCTAGQLEFNSSTTNGKLCTAANTWTALSASSGLTQLTGDVTAGPGNGSVGATVAKINGTTVPTNAAADQTLITTASSVGAWTSLANCVAAGGVLQYATATHSYACHTLASADIPAALANTTSVNGTTIPSSATLMTTATALVAAQEPAHTGDATNSAGSLVMTLATVNGAPGSCGDATHVCQVTTNGKGLVTSQSAVATNAPQVNAANTYSGGGLQDFSAMKVKPAATTVASLPAASSNNNVVYMVTDGASTTDCATGGGSTAAWCRSNGASWLAMTASGGSGANANGYYLVNQASNAPANAINLGGGSTGLLRQSVSGGVATLTETELSGDATTSGSNAVTLAAVNADPGLCGDANHVCQVTTNGKGLVTNQSAVAIAAGGGNASIAQTTVAFSATPTFTRTANIMEFTITLTGNVTSSTLAGAAANDILIFQVCQDATGNRTFAWPTGFANASSISPTAGVCTKQQFVWDGANANPSMPGTSTDNPFLISGALERAAPVTPGNGVAALWPDSSRHTWTGLDNGSANVHIMPRTAGGTDQLALADLSNGTAAGIVGLFSSCSGTQYLGADGSCHTASGGGGTPGGSSGQVQYNNGGAFGGFTVSGDAALNTGTGALTIAAGAVTSAKLAVVNTRRTCTIDNDTQSATALTAAQFAGGCKVPYAATIVEIDVWGGTGTLGGAITTTGASSVNLQKYTPNGGATATILSAPLATASGKACAMTSTSGTCIDGTTSSSSVTISTTALSAGDWIQVSVATPDAAQTWYRIAVVYTVN